MISGLPCFYKVGQLYLFRTLGIWYLLTNYKNFSAFIAIPYKPSICYSVTLFLYRLYSILFYLIVNIRIFFWKLKNNLSTYKLTQLYKLIDCCHLSACTFIDYAKSYSSYGRFKKSLVYRLLETGYLFKYFYYKLVKFSLCNRIYIIRYSSNYT